MTGEHCGQPVLTFFQLTALNSQMVGDYAGSLALVYRTTPRIEDVTGVSKHSEFLEEASEVNRIHKVGQSKGLCRRCLK